MPDEVLMDQFQNQAAPNQLNQGWSGGLTPEQQREYEQLQGEAAHSQMVKQRINDLSNDELEAAVLSNFGQMQQQTEQKIRKQLEAKPFEASRDDNLSPGERLHAATLHHKKIMQDEGYAKRFEDEQVRISGKGGTRRYWTERMPGVGGVQAYMGMKDRTRILKNIEEGKASQRDYDLMGLYLAGDWQERQPKSFIRKTGDILSRLPGFMIEMGASGGWAAAAKAGVQKGVIRGAQKAAGKRAGTALATRAVGGVAGELSAAAAATAHPAMWGQIAGSLARQHAPDFEIDEKTGGGFEVELKKHAESLGSRLYKGMMDTYIEVLSERLGGKMTGAVKAPFIAVLNKLPKSRLVSTGVATVGGALEKTSKRGPGAVRRFMAKGGMHGPIEEIGEEYFGDWARSLSYTLDERPEMIEVTREFLKNPTDKKARAEFWNNVGPMMVSFAMLSSGGAAIDTYVNRGKELPEILPEDTPLQRELEGLPQEGVIQVARRQRGRETMGKAADYLGEVQRKLEDSAPGEEYEQEKAALIENLRTIQGGTLSRSQAKKIKWPGSDKTLYDMMPSAGERKDFVESMLSLTDASSDPGQILEKSLAGIEEQKGLEAAAAQEAAQEPAQQPELAQEAPQVQQQLPVAERLPVTERAPKPSQAAPLYEEFEIPENPTPAQMLGVKEGETDIELISKQHEERHLRAQMISNGPDYNKIEQSETLLNELMSAKNEMVKAAKAPPAVQETQQQETQEQETQEQEQVLIGRLGQAKVDDIAAAREAAAEPTPVTEPAEVAKPTPAAEGVASLVPNVAEDIRPVVGMAGLFGGAGAENAAATQSMQHPITELYRDSTRRVGGKARIVGETAWVERLEKGDFSDTWDSPESFFREYDAAIKTLEAMEQGKKGHRSEDDSSLMESLVASGVIQKGDTPRLSVEGLLTSMKLPMGSKDKRYDAFRAGMEKALVKPTPATKPVATEAPTPTAEAPAEKRTSVFNKDTYTLTEGQWIKDRTGKPTKSPRIIAGLEKAAKAPAAELTPAAPEAAEVVERGKRFSTGVPVTFTYARSTEAAPDMGETYQQHIEPAGRYMVHPTTAGETPGFEQGEVTFENPLVLRLSKGSKIYGPQGWKAVLSNRYGGKTGEELSQAIRDDGYDGIVTVRFLKGKPVETGEIVALTTPAAPTAAGEPAKRGKAMPAAKQEKTPEGREDPLKGRYVTGHSITFGENDQQEMEEVSGRVAEEDQHTVTLEDGTELNRNSLESWQETEDGEAQEFPFDGGIMRMSFGFEEGVQSFADAWDRFIKWYDPWSKRTQTGRTVHKTFNAGGILGKEAHTEVIMNLAKVKADVQDMNYLVRDLIKALKNSDWDATAIDKLSSDVDTHNKRQADLNTILTSPVEDAEKLGRKLGISSDIVKALAGMRGKVDSLSDQMVEMLRAQGETNEQFKEQFGESLINVILANKGFYLTRMYQAHQPGTKWGEELLEEKPKVQFEGKEIDLYEEFRKEFIRNDLIYRRGKWAEKTYKGLMKKHTRSGGTFVRMRAENRKLPKEERLSKEELEAKFSEMRSVEHDAAVQSAWDNVGELTDREIDGAIAAIVKPKGSKDMPGYTEMGKADFALFAARKLGNTRFHQLYRMMLGEYTDPVENALLTVRRMSQALATHQAQQSLIELNDKLPEGEKWFIDSKRRESVEVDGKRTDYIVPIPETGEYGPLAGKWATKGFIEGLKDTFGSSGAVPYDMTEAGSYLMYQVYGPIIGYARASKTIYSARTQVRNFVSNASIAMVMGHAGWRGNFVDSWRAAGINLWKGDSAEEIDDKKAREFVSYLHKLGVLGDTAAIGEIAKMMGDVQAMSPQEFLYQGPRHVDESIIKKGFAGVRRGLAASNRIAAGFYQAGDDIWKIQAWLYNKQMLTEAYPAGSSEAKKLLKEHGKSAAELGELLEKLAAVRVRDQFPTYSNSPPAVRMLRWFPLAGTFPTWWGEFVRTQYYRIPRQAWADIKSGNERLAVHGRNTLIRGVFVNTMLPTVVTMGLGFLWKMAGYEPLEPEEEKDLRTLLPPWSKTSTLFTYKKDGKTHYVDLSYALPHVRPLDLWRYYSSSEDTRKEMIAETQRKLTGDFTSPDMLARKLLELVLGERIATGSKIFNKHDTFGEQVEKSFKHLSSIYEPGTITSLRHLTKGLLKTKDEYGQQHNPSVEFYSTILGARAVEMNFERDLSFKVWEFKDGLAEAKRLSEKIGRSKANNRLDDYLKYLPRTEKARRLEFRRFAQKMRAYRNSGLTDSKIRAALKEGGLNERDRGAVMRGVYSPYVMSEVIRQEIRKTPDGPAKVDGYRAHRDRERNKRNLE